MATTNSRTCGDPSRKRSHRPGAMRAFCITNIENYVAGLILLLFGASASATPITIWGSAAFDVDTAVETLVTLNSPTGGAINDLNLFIDFDADCCGFDNTVILSHLDTGTSATIWFDAKDVDKQLFGDVRNTTFDDEAPTAFVNAPLIYNTDTYTHDILTGTYRAAGLLSAFDGEDFSGTWELSIQNTGGGIGEGDDLLAWAIIADVTTVPAPAPMVLGLMSIGLLGVGVATKKRKKA
jgi:hypothetical protein